MDRFQVNGIHVHQIHAVISANAFAYRSRRLSFATVRTAIPARHVQVSFCLSF
uniref:Transposase n=1 Tax=Ascaris lumbricoides TaxID=6252 RepID=A0A0M3HM92_ASCLU